MSIKTEFLLLGGGLASAFASETLRKEGAQGSIVILSAENILPYHRPQLPKAFLLGKREKELLYIFNENFYQKNGIEVMLDTKALWVDSKKKIVKTDHAGDINYKKLLIATGCRPKKIDVPGCHLQGIRYLNNIPDAEAIMQEMVGAKNVVIIGGNYIGIELAASFMSKGINVTILAQEFIIFNVHPHAELCTFLQYHGVNIVHQESIKEFKGHQHVQSVETSSGKSLPCDFVVVVEGREPETDFLHESGIPTDDGIIVNQYMQTNQSGIYAAGDVARFYDPIYCKLRRIEGWDNAAKQGKIAAMNMMGDRNAYRTATYFFFNAFGNSFVLVGDATDCNERIIRGSINDRNFAVLFLKDGLMQAGFFSGRPITEIKAAESLIVNHTDLSKLKKKLSDIHFSMEEIATQTILALQGGGALGAFECGVVKAMEEYKIYPDIVAGISIGAFNSAIIASNPKNATAALEAFWAELSVDTLNFMPADEGTRRYLSSLSSIVWGSKKFFHPRWLMPFDDNNELLTDWTSFYDPSPIKNLLHKYINFAQLKESPIRLLLMAVNVETAEFETFDSYTDEITVEHILASGSLPPGFPWTTINGKHYWDGGIVSNTPLDSTLEICGATSKKVYIIDLYPRKRSLPKNMTEVLTRKDEILFSEKIRKDVREQDQISNYRKLVDATIKFCEPAIAEEIKQLPIYIQTMGDPGILSMTRIVRELDTNEPYSWDSDFSRETIEDHKLKGYEAARKILKKTIAKLKDK
jgi:NADPH-dependent 2,4-dienoyl-CoA reductase/sulfur reductase-like enzyme/predicted acylesterase/phospholipase RssA